MQVYHNIDQIPYLGNAVVTIGNFDGVHLGHSKILSSLALEHSNGLESMVITFWPHPKIVLAPNSPDLKFLCTIVEKTELLKKQGIKHLLILPFTKEFSEISAFDFVKQLLFERIGVKKILLGYDNHFGKNREGNIGFLKAHAQVFGFELQEIPKQEVEHMAISSSQIRHHLLEGQVREAALLLGRHYAVQGMVIEGNKRGRTIGFPTANLDVQFTGKLIPKMGVYAVLVTVDQVVHKGVMNIGYRPTIGGDTLSLEVHLFDFARDIYGQRITVEFIDYLRSEQKFASLEALKDQIHLDSAKACQLLV